jgi:glutamyl/glutaminyl-tRNA synthetase
LVVAGDILDYAYFFVADEHLEMDAKAVDKHLTRPPLAPQWWQPLGEQFATLEPFDAPTVEACVRHYAEMGGLKLGDVSQGLRVATTGRATGFGTFETLVLLGRDRVVARMARAEEQLRSGG